MKEGRERKDRITDLESVSAKAEAPKEGRGETTPSSGT